MPEVVDRVGNEPVARTVAARFPEVDESRLGVGSQSYVQFFVDILPDLKDGDSYCVQAD